MSGPPRYAIYYVPAADAGLYRFGASIIGYDAFEAKDLAQPSAAVQAFSDWHALTADPRKYGFHATLKAPFRLAVGQDEAGLCKAFDRFAETPRELPAIAPVVRAISSFIAVVPDVPVAALSQLADDCVTAFEPFRAPLSAFDRARRLKSPLTPRQIEHLDRWGYPYVFEEFRFHMTLTGSLPTEKREAVLPFLRSEFAKLGLASFAVEHIALLRQQRSDARFEVLRQATLRFSGFAART
jgi:putative phosphonate metabolism protein